jgi:hypothetical protein
MSVPNSEPLVDARLISDPAVIMPDRLLADMKLGVAPPALLT